MHPWGPGHGPSLTNRTSGGILQGSGRGLTRGGFCANHCPVARASACSGAHRALGVPHRVRGPLGWGLGCRSTCVPRCASVTGSAHRRRSTATAPPPPPGPCHTPHAAPSLVPDTTAPLVPRGPAPLSVGGTAHACARRCLEPPPLAPMTGRPPPPRSLVLASGGVYKVKENSSSVTCHGRLPP